MGVVAFREPHDHYSEFCAPRVEAGYELEMVRRGLIAHAARQLPDGTAEAAQSRQGNGTTGTMVEGWVIAGAGEGPVSVVIVVHGGSQRLLRHFHDADVAFSRVRAQHLQRFLIGRAVIGGEREFDTVEFDHDRALG